MSNARRKVAEPATWPGVGSHVWHTKCGELTVVNLRDPLETLKGVDIIEKTAPFTSAPLSAPRPAAKPSTNPRSSQTKDGEAAGLTKPHARTSHPTASPVCEAKPEVAVAKPTADPVSTHAGQGLPNSRAKATGLPSSEKPVTPNSWPSRSQCSGVSTQQQVLRSEPSAPPAATETEASQLKSAAFEFIAGTNIPGHGVVTPTDVEESPGLALFHDPVWGGGPSLWATNATSKKSSTPPATEVKRPASKPLFDIFGTGLKSGMSGDAQHTQLAAMQGLATPSAGLFTTSTAVDVASSGALSSSILMSPGGYPGAVPMGGVTQVHMAPRTMGGYPMMGIPVSYMAPAVLQQPQLFPTNVVPYGLSTFYTIGEVPASMAPAAAVQTQPQVPARSAVKPASGGSASSPTPVAGTNVEAKPFVPGGIR